MNLHMKHVTHNAFSTLFLTSCESFWAELLTYFYWSVQGNLNFPFCLAFFRVCPLSYSKATSIFPGICYRAVHFEVLKSALVSYGFCNKSQRKNSSLTQNNYFTIYRSQVQMGCHWPKIKSWISSGNFRGKFTFLPFLASRGYPHSWDMNPPHL